MSDGFSERWDGPSECPTASPSVGMARRNVRRLLRALGWPVGISAGFSEHWGSPSECPTASPSVGMARRNIRRLLRALGQPVGMSAGFSERWGSPSECPTAYFYFNVGRLLPSMSSYSQPVPFNAPFMPTMASSQVTFVPSTCVTPPEPLPIPLSGLPLQ